MINYSDDQKKQINELRKQLGTLPEQVPDLDVKEIESLIDDPTKWEVNKMGIKVGPFQFYEGVRGVSAELIDNTTNPYKVLYEIAVATWGPEEYPTMWGKASPENRFYIVKNVLRGKALPLGNEAVNFTFIMRGPSRAAFDQHARQRIGAVFASQGVRDNSRLLSGFRMPNEVWRNEDKRNEVIKHVLRSKILYYNLVRKDGGNNSYQAARCIFEMGWTHNYKYSVNYEALKGYMSRRLVASEQEDTVATALAIWNEINKKFPLLATRLRPKCDWAGRCLCHQGSGDEVFGALFKGCGRFLETESNYATFNWACSDYNLLEEQTGINLPYPAIDYWKEKGKNVWKDVENYEDLADSDKALFEEDYKPSN